MKLHSLGYLMREGAKSLWKNRTMTVASIGVLLSCLFLMGLAGLLSMNLSDMMKSVEGKNTIVVYLAKNIPTLKSIQLGERLDEIDNISTCTFVSKQEGLENVIDILGDNGDLLYNLSDDENFLPDGYRVTMKDLNQYTETIQKIESVEGVDTITDYSDIASKLNSMDKLVRYAGIAVVLVLGIISLFIISNTIKVTMFSRRAEMSIMKSVGATNSFVRVPFIVEGVIIGIVAGAASATLLYFIYQKVIDSLNAIVPYMGGGIDIKPVIVLIFAAYITVGALFGVLGCGISMGKYLKKEGDQAIV